MTTDDIIEVTIDGEGKLSVRPHVCTFPNIYRAAMQVGWDPDKRILFSPQPGDWSYLKWFRQIIAAATGEYGVHLVTTPKTIWTDVPDALRRDIETEWLKIRWSKAADAILSIGLSLKEAGVENWALTREQSLDALAKLDAAGIPVLGGDVYQLAKGKLRLTYDNWHCNWKGDETTAEFVTRSAAAARSYITEYRPPDESGLYFAIVPAISRQ